MDTMTPDHWWDKNQSDGNLLKHFSDKELRNELNRRQEERRKLEILKVIGFREAIGYFIIVTNDEHVEWTLNIVFSNGTKYGFVFSSKIGQNESTVDSFKNLYFPNLPRLQYKTYKEYEIWAENLFKNQSKKKICRSPQ